MKPTLAHLSLAVLTASAISLTSCVIPAGGYGGPPAYGGGYGGGGYGPPPDDGGGYAYEEAGEVAMLPAGAVVVVEGGERHWYYHGQCYRRGPHGYVILHKKPVHHVDHRDPGYYKKPEQKKYYPQQHVEHHEEHRDVHNDGGLIKKNGHYYKKGPHGELILVK